MSDPILHTSGLRKRYDKKDAEVSVLNGIDLEVFDGDFITIMGPSGAGKSTLLHLLGALDRPTEGEILFRGRNILDFSEEETSRFRNEKVGFIFQFYHLLQDFNVIENIMMPLLIRRERPEVAADKAGRFLDTMGLTARRHHKPGELSGGEQQRVAIARALVNEPEIILADEPTGNLDRKTGREVLHYLLSFREKLSSTLILVTHDPEVGSAGSRRLTMVDGELFHENP